MNANIFINDIKRKPVTTLLTIIITAIGLITAFLILTLYVAESETDRILPEYQRLYRIESQFNLPNGDTVRSAKIPFPLVDALQKNSDIDSVGYAYRLDTQLHYQGNIVPQVTIFAVTPAFIEQLHPYGYHLPPPGSHEIYITADFNHQYLGLDDPLGKTVMLGENGLFTIKAIIKSQPNSSLNLQAIIAFTPDLVAEYQDKRQDWYDTHVYAFARLQPSRTNFDQQILTQIIARSAPQLPGAPFTPSSFLTFSAKPLADMHYDDGYADEFVTTTSQSLLYMLYTAALFILFSTVANFFNINGILNTSKRPSQHIKRSLGASNTQLLAESLSTLLPQFLITVALAIFLLCILTPLSSDINSLLAHQPLSRTITVFSTVALFIGLVMLFSHLLSLSLLIFSKPASDTLNRYTNRRLYDLNRIMMVVQLIVAGITVYLWAGVMTQNHTISHADFGYQKTQRLTFALDEGFYSLGSMRELEHRLQETENTSAISLSSWQPFNMSRQIISVQYARQLAANPFIAINTLSGDRNFIDVWGLTTLSGQTNTLQASTDDGVYHAVVTRAFMHAMGQKSFDEVLNTRYSLSFPERQLEMRVLRIVEDFDLGDHLSTPQPLIIFIHDRLERFATLAYPKETSPETLIRQIKSYGPGLSVQTVQELHNSHFHNDQQILKIVTFTAILALVLMVISTLVLSISEAQRLSHTLKIMEAVGGSVATSLLFFLQQHLLPILISSLTALVLGYLLLQRWLRQYEFVAGLVYINGFAALLLLSLMVFAIMTLSLVLCSARNTRSRLRRK